MKNFGYIVWGTIFLNIFLASIVLGWRGRSKPIRRSLRVTSVQDIRALAKKNERKSERRRLRKEKRKKIFSSLAHACLYALKVGVSHGASALFEHIPKAIAVWKNESNSQRSISAFNKNNRLEVVGLFVDSVLEKISLEKIKNNPDLEILQVLACAPAGIQRYHLIERLILLGNIEELLEKLFFGVCTTLPKNQERAIRLVYQQKITAKSIATQYEQKKTSKGTR